MTNYEPMWAVVDGLRQVSDSLENWTREATGDRPAPEVDKIDGFATVREILLAAMDTLREVVDRRGYVVTAQIASRCGAATRQCNRAIEILDAVGEL